MEMNVDQTIDVKSGEHLLEEQRMCIVGNVEEVCRVCLAVGELEPLADSSVYSTYQLLLHSFNCKSDSELLKNICKHCIKELEGISSFITKFKKSCSILSTIQEYEKGSHPISEDKVNHHETSTEHSNDSDESPKNNIEEIIIDSQDYQDQADFSENEEEESITNAPLPRLTIYPKNQKNKLQPIIHAKSHKIPAYSCSICGQSFLSKKSLDMHSALHTEDDHEVNEIIQLGVDKKTALDKPSDKPYVCNVCGKGFVYEISWKYHIISHTQEKLCECTFCDWSGMNELELNDHVRKDHCHKAEKSVDEESNEDYACRICGEYCTSRITLREHLNSHEKKFECKHCGLKFRMNSTLIKHLTHHNDEGIFDCTHCDKILTRKVSLKRHMEMKHGNGEDKKPEYIYFCSTCNKGFFFKKNLMKHVELHKQKSNGGDQEAEDLSCQHCDKKFTYRANLLRHVRITHAGVKKFECSLCKEKFTVKNSLIYHMNIHNNAKPFQCDICSRAFRQPSALIRHQRQVHQVKDKKFKCEICVKYLKSNISLKAHMKRHEEA